MAKAKNVWGLDIGQCALKALKLTEVEGEIQVEAFEIIEHAKILSEPDADSGALIHDALMQFMATHAIRGSTLVVAVPGQSSFTRFVKLPPVEKRRIPDIVRFEAEQQIPFPIDEVIWQWQTFQDPDSPDVEVGIFAMKRGDVAQILQHFTDVGIDVDLVQMAPLSLYNFMTHDGQASEEGATLLADVGADKTDLVVADGARIWTRTIQIGGNSFTQALVRAFKLSFDKAEKLKRTAASSKYARQIFQAMRPVFADLVQEIQRSIGYYTSLHRESRFQKLVGLGNGFRLPGLQKFLEQNLNITVARVDSYNNLNVSDAVNAPQFSENALSFAVAYGLALQGLGRTPVDTNLLPGEILRKRQWSKKRPWFAAAAAVLLTCLAGPIYRAITDKRVLAQGQSQLNEAKGVVDGIKRQYGERAEDVIGRDGKKIDVDTEEKYRQKAMVLLAYRNFWPLAQAMVFRALERVAADQGKLLEYAHDHEQWVLKKDERNRRLNAGETEADVADLTDRINELLAKMKRFKDTERTSRKVVLVEGWTTEYVADLKAASLSEEGPAKESGPPPLLVIPTDMRDRRRRGSDTVSRRPRREVVRGFIVRVTARTHMAQRRAIPEILSPLQRALVTSSEQIEELSILDYPEVRLLPKLGATDAKSRTPRRSRDFGLDVGAGERTPPAGTPKTTKEDEIKFPDPLLPKDESMAEDTRFTISFKLAVDSPGLGQKAEPEKKTPTR